MNNSKPQANGITQITILFDYLKTTIATTSMVSNAIGIKRTNLTGYKRILERYGILFELHKGICETTGFKATYLTTNPDLRPQTNKLKIK